MKIKKGDKVKILAGKDRGKSGVVLRVLLDRQKIVVEAVNMLVKHLRPRREKEKGQRVQFPAPLAVSNVSLICPKCGRDTRVGLRRITNEAGKTRSFRVCKKCSAEI